MKLTLDIGNEEFDAVVGNEMDVPSTIFLNFPSDIRGVYEFELINSLVNIYNFKDQIEEQGLQIEDDSLLVFGKMKICIEGVKGADFKFVEGDFHTGGKQYHTWPYILNKDDVVCICGGDLSFLSGYYASIIIIAESNHRITLTFDTDEAVPIDIRDSSSIRQAHSKAFKYQHTKSPGRLFDFSLFQEYLAGNRKVIKSE